MKFLTTSATVILMYSGVTMAQVPGGQADAVQLPEVKIVTGNESKHARHADARHCLTLKTDV